MKYNAPLTNKYGHIGKKMSSIVLKKSSTDISVGIAMLKGSRMVLRATNRIYR